MALWPTLETERLGDKEVEGVSEGARVGVVEEPNDTVRELEAV